MWPWEHVAVGYLALSVGTHLLRRRPPTDREAIAAAVGSVLPDLIDKPLAWGFGAFPSGYGAAHSVLFALPAAAAVVAFARARGRTGLGPAAAVGYLSHLPADLFPTAVADGRVPVERVLWPVRTASSTYPEGFLGTFRSYLRAYVGGLLAGDVDAAILLPLAAVGLCLVVWVRDGVPGLRPVLALASGRPSDGTGKR